MLGSVLYKGYTGLESNNLCKERTNQPWIWLEIVSETIKISKIRGLYLNLDHYSQFSLPISLHIQWRFQEWTAAAIFNTKSSAEIIYILVKLMFVRHSFHIFSQKKNCLFYCVNITAIVFWSKYACLLIEIEGVTKTDIQNQ